MIVSDVEANAAESNITGYWRSVPVQRRLLGNTADGRAIPEFISSLNG